MPRTFRTMAVHAFTAAVFSVTAVTLHSNPGIALPCFQLFPGFKYMGFLHRNSGTLYSKAGRSSGQSSSGF
jgi:hypothetical protein